MSGIDGIASWNSFAGFSELHIEAGGVAFRGVTGGSGGPPVLLLHGYPQTHLAWRHVAPRLAQSFTVVAPDLPGYGSSRADSDRPRWTKRRVANALIALMAKLGHRRFAVVGHGGTRRIPPCARLPGACDALRLAGRDSDPGCMGSGGRTIWTHQFPLVLPGPAIRAPGKAAVRRPAGIHRCCAGPYGGRAGQCRAVRSRGLSACVPRSRCSARHLRGLSGSSAGGPRLRCGRPCRRQEAVLPRACALATRVGRPVPHRHLVPMGQQRPRRTHPGRPPSTGGVARRGIGSDASISYGHRGFRHADRRLVSLRIRLTCTRLPPAIIPARIDCGGRSCAHEKHPLQPMGRCPAWNSTALRWNGSITLASSFHGTTSCIRPRNAFHRVTVSCLQTRPMRNSTTRGLRAP